MSYILYAYRPQIGVAVCKHGNHWLLVEWDEEEGASEIISEDESMRLANRLNLLDFQRTFPNFGQLKRFLADEYLALQPLAPPAIDPDQEVAELLEFLDQQSVLQLIDRVALEAEAERNVQNGINLLEAIEAHPKHEGDIVLLARLNPLKQKLKRLLGKDNLVPRQTVGQSRDFNEKYASLAGRSDLGSQLADLTSLAAA
jgi:hypothetical protein